jgi:hypothetical protein
VLAALVFMAILIPVALQGLSLASRAGELAARKSEAGLIADRVLNESIITTNWNNSAQSGTVRQGGREFTWSLKNESWNQDPGQSAMRLLSVEVKFAAQAQNYSVRLSTLVDTTPPMMQTNSQ